MEQKVTLSDFSTAIIPGEDVVKVIVRHHPSLEGEVVELDAGEAEIKPLLAGAGDYVMLDLIKGDQTKSIVAELLTFHGLFKDDAYQALANARRVRAPSNGQKRGNAGELAKIREWAAANGYEVNAKGRIKQDIVDAYHAANPAA